MNTAGESRISISSAKSGGPGVSMQLNPKTGFRPGAIRDLAPAGNIARLVIAALVLVGAGCDHGLQTSPKRDAASPGLDVSLDIGAGLSLDSEGDLGLDRAIEFSPDGGIDASSVDGAMEFPPVDGGTVLVPDGGHSQADSIDGGEPVRGTVLGTGSGYSFPGRKVVIGAQSTVTDVGGRFSFEQVAETYDVIVVEPGGWNVSVYYGLTRRDPILSDSGGGGSSLDSPAQSVSITGTLTADFSFPVDSAHLVTVYYLADHGHGAVQVGAGLVSAGPGYGPLWVGWNGDTSITGSLVAIGQYGVVGTPWTKGYLASKPLSLVGGDAPTQDLALAEVSIGKIGGTIQMYSGNPLQGVHFTYRLPGMMGGIELGRCGTSGTYSCGLPDLTALGGDYCVSVVDLFGVAQAQKCGGRIGMSDLSIQVQPPPQFQKPADGSPITKDSKLSWTGMSNGVYMLDLSPDKPSASSPYIQVYTSATQLLWPDLRAIGVAFPADVTYTCQVSGLSPYASMDDLASSRGPFNAEMDGQWLDSGKIHLSLVQ
jgi:hypothetical protein